MPLHNVADGKGPMFLIANWRQTCQLDCTWEVSRTPLLAWSMLLQLPFCSHVKMGGNLAVPLVFIAPFVHSLTKWQSIRVSLLFWLSPRKTVVGSNVKLSSLLFFVLSDGPRQGLLGGCIVLLSYVILLWIVTLLLFQSFRLASGPYHHCLTMICQFLELSSSKPIRYLETL